MKVVLALGFTYKWNEISCLYAESFVNILQTLWIHSKLTHHNMQPLYSFSSTQKNLQLESFLPVLSCPPMETVSLILHIVCV